MPTIGADMRRLAVRASAVGLAMALLSGCGGSHGQQDHGSPRVAVELVRDRALTPVVLSLSGLGKFEGTCPPGARSWTLQYIDDSGATETVSYRIGTGPRRTVNVDKAITPDATRTHEPAFAPPVGQPHGRSNALSVPTTVPIDALIYQATEPQTLRADVHLALAASDRESGRCELVGSTVRAYAYPNG